MDVEYKLLKKKDLNMYLTNVWFETCVKKNVTSFSGKKCLLTLNYSITECFSLNKITFMLTNIEDNPIMNKMVYNL